MISQFVGIFLSFQLLVSLQLHSQDRYNYVFSNGTEGYACFRIPAIIKAPNGDLLAFAEARKKNCSDFGDIDLVMKRSSNNGKTWSPLHVVIDNQLFKAGDPAPVLDAHDPAYPQGRIFLMYNISNTSESGAAELKGFRQALFVTSTDNGMSWSAPVDITLQVHKPKFPSANPEYNFEQDWRTIANTPGHAMQFSKGRFKGRIYVAANHSAGPKPANNFSNYRAHGYYSDDHGKSWTLTPDIDIPGSNESTAAELSDGSLLQNARYQDKEKGKYRILAKSSSGGASWDTVYVSRELPEPICEGSMLPVRQKGKFYLLFSNPRNQVARKDMCITVSDNDGISWARTMLVDSGNAAYSDMVQLNRAKIGILYERGNSGGIVYKQYRLKEILKPKRYQKKN